MITALLTALVLALALVLVVIGAGCVAVLAIIEIGLRRAAPWARIAPPR